MNNIPNFPGYTVDENGNVWSQRKGRNGSGNDVCSWKPVKPRRMKHGHLFVTLRCDGRGHKRYVHRLVLETFVGPCPEGMECRHLNSVPWDNRLENLVWGTKSENEADKIAVGKTNRADRNGMAKLTWEKVVAIRADFATGNFTQAELCKKYGVGCGRMSNIINGKAWTHPAFMAQLREVLSGS